MGLLDALTQLVSTATQQGGTQSHQVDAVVDQASPDVLSQGLRAAFDATDTPSIGNLVGQMFGQSSSQQQAGLVNQIIQALGPAAAGALAVRRQRAGRGHRLSGAARWPHRRARGGTCHRSFDQL